MTGPLPVKGKEISSAPCSVRKAASLLRRFLSSEAALEVGIARGYIEAVAQSLEEILTRGKDNGTEGLKLRTAGRRSKFFNLDQVPEVPEIKKKSRKEKESKQKKKEHAMVDFEALLGHELDGTEIGKEADGELVFEEKTEMLPSTPRQVHSVDGGREFPKSEKKKKKRKSLGGAAMDVDMNGTQSSRKAEDSDPENSKSAKKKKKRKSLDSVMISNGPSSPPAEEVKAEARAEDDDMKPADDLRKKKKKKHRGDTSQGATPMKEESKKVLTEHFNSIIGDRGSNGNDSGMQQQGNGVKKKSKKRSSEVSPGNSDDQHRKSKKLRLSD